MIGWRATCDAIAADRARLREFAAAQGLASRAGLSLGALAMLLHRLAHYLHGRGWRFSARLIWGLNISITGAEIGPSVRIGKGTIIPYPRTVAIYGTVGEDCAFLGQCGIGGQLRPPLGLPTLGDRVVLAAGAMVLGPRRIGDGVHVGARCIVTRDLPDGAVVLPLPWQRTQAAANAPAASTPAADGAPARNGTWRAMRQAMRADRERHAAYYAGIAGARREPGYLHAGRAAVALHRVAHWLHGAGWRRCAGGMRMLGLLATGADISPACRIGPGLVLPNPQTVTINGDLGRNCTVNAQTSIGWQVPLPGGFAAARRDPPVIGDEVVLAPGAFVMAGVRVGHRARIGARALVDTDVADDGVVHPLAWRLSRL